MSDDEPIRLRDDPRASPLLREALRRTAATPAVVPPDASADLARFEAALASAGAQAPAAPTAAVRSTLARWAAHGGLWWGLAAVGLAGAVFVARGRASPAPTRPSSATRSAEATAAPVSHTAAPVAAPAPALSPALSPAPVPASAPALAAPPTATQTAAARARTATARPPARTAHGPPPSVTEPTTGDALQREMRHLAQVRAERVGDPARALALAEAGHREFAGGIFYEEREALAVMALAQLGRGREAHRRAERFLARHPRGPFSERIRQLVGLAPTAPQR